jgi:hypothetical protein
MIDHLGFPVSDYERSKAFYAAALAPLGYVLIMEVLKAKTIIRRRDSAAAASRISGSAGRAASTASCMWRSRLMSVRASTPSIAPRLRRAERTTARPACGRTTTRTTTRPSYAIPTATMSRPCVTGRPERGGDDTRSACSNTAGGSETAIGPRPLGPYPAGTIWVSQGHEVITAEPRHVPTLFGTLLRNHWQIRLRFPASKAKIIKSLSKSVRSNFPCPYQIASLS